MKQHLRRIARRAAAIGAALAVCLTSGVSGVGSWSWGHDGGSSSSVADPVAEAAVSSSVIQGKNGTIDENLIGGYSTMKDYISDTSNFKYVDNMTVNDYKTGRSASYDKNDNSTGRNSTDYLMQSVEWTNADKGEALLTVAGKDTTNSRVVYVFETCLYHGLKKSIVKQNILDLMAVYDQVDCVCVNVGYTLDDARFWGATSGSRDFAKGHSHGAIGSMPGALQRNGINPYVSFYSEDYSNVTEQVTDISRYLAAIDWIGGDHSTIGTILGLKAYLFGDISYATWNDAINLDYSMYSHAAYRNTAPAKSASDSRDDDYLEYVRNIITTDISKLTLVNNPDAIFISGDNVCNANKDANLAVYAEKDLFVYIADNYANASKDVYYFMKGGNSRTVNNSKNSAGWTAYNIYDAIAQPYVWAYDASYKSAHVFSYSKTFVNAGVIMPDKQLSFDIPIGDSWQVDTKNLSAPNIIYTYKFADTSSKSGQYCTQSAKGDKLTATATIDNNHVIHITTNTYVKGAEISVQIPLKYSNGGMQSANQLYAAAPGNSSSRAYTSKEKAPSEAQPVTDTYVLHMTTGDTLLHVGRKTLGDINTDLSIVMDPKTLMDVNVNLHWVRDSADIKNQLRNAGDAELTALANAVRTNASAMIGSEASYNGDALGKMSNDDEAAGGRGSSVVGLKFPTSTKTYGAEWGTETYTDAQGHTKNVVNDSVDVQRGGYSTVAEDEAGMDNVISYKLCNLPRYGIPTKNTYENGYITSSTDLSTTKQRRWYYVEDVIGVPTGYTAYNIDSAACSSKTKLQKATGSDSTNLLTYNKPLYYYYTITPPSNWDQTTKITDYTIDCYLSLDIKALQMTVKHYKEEMDNTYNASSGYYTQKAAGSRHYVEVPGSSKTEWVPYKFIFSPEVNTYTGYDSPAKQSVTVEINGLHTVNYYYNLHYYNLSVDTAGGDWTRERDDGSWENITPPPAHYTIQTPTFTLPQPNMIGCDFLGYTGINTPNNTLSVSIAKGSTGDKSFVAHWQAQPYDIDVPVSLLFSMGWEGTMKGAFDQDGLNTYTDKGQLINNSAFPVQVTGIQYVNDSVFKITPQKSDDPNVKNIMDWRLDAVNKNPLGGSAVGTKTTNIYADKLLTNYSVKDDPTYYMAQRGKGVIDLDADQGWMLHDVPDVKDPIKIGDIVWTFDVSRERLMYATVPQYASNQ